MDRTEDCPDNANGDALGPASPPEILSVRPSRNRAAPIVLPSDPAESSAMVLSFIQTGGSVPLDRSAAIEAAAQRVNLLRNPDPDVAFAELAGHASILDALFQRYSAQAVMATNPDAISRFGKLALHTQATYTRTLIALEGLKQQRRQRARVTLDPDNDSGPDSGF